MTTKTSPCQAIPNSFCLTFDLNTAANLATQIAEVLVGVRDRGRVGQGRGHSPVKLSALDVTMKEQHS